MNNPQDPKFSITSERLRQAKYSFNLAFGVVSLSFGLGFVGAILLLSGRLSEGAISSVVGFASSVPAVRFAKEKSDRLDKLLAEFDD
jgi:hypothetical protein